MIRIAVVEDEQEYAHQLESYLYRYESENKSNFKISYFADGDGITAGYKSQFDIILMDIKMRLVDGMSAAKEIRKVDSEVIIIFITNMRQYAIRGYEVDALDYIVKPISYFEFSQRLEKAIDKISCRKKQVISVNVTNGVLRMDVRDIWYAESVGHMLIYHTVSGEHEYRKTLKQAEEELIPYHFFKANRSCLINLAQVESITNECAIVHGEKIFISRIQKKPLMEALVRYWNEVE